MKKSLEYLGYKNETVDIWIEEFCKDRDADELTEISSTAIKSEIEDYCGTISNYHIMGLECNIPDLELMITVLKKALDEVEQCQTKLREQAKIRIYNGPTQKVIQFVTHDEQVTSQYYIEYNDIQISFKELCNIIEDAISSYIESVDDWQQEEMIEDVLASIPEITNFHPLVVSKTFVI